MAERPYERLQGGYLTHHEGDETCKPFAEVFSRFVGLAQPSASRNAQDQQKDGPPRTKGTVLNNLSSGGEGPVDKANMQHADIVSISER